MDVHLRFIEHLCIAPWFRSRRLLWCNGIRNEVTFQDSCHRTAGRKRRQRYGAVDSRDALATDDMQSEQDGVAGHIRRKHVRANIAESVQGSGRPGE